MLNGKTLTLLDRSMPLDGALAMAIDEVLLRQAAHPILRLWSWRRTTVTIGCFVRIDEALALAGNLGSHARNPVLVRRLTGGGCVLHQPGRDLSFALVVPHGHALAALRPVESYRWIHERLASVLRDSGVDAAVAPASDDRGRDCYRCPSRYDLVAAATGAKLVGAGQKRTRRGMLHQGNIRADHLPPDFPARFAAALADAVRVAPLSRAVLESAAELSRTKYAIADWTAKF